jgi:hypothetical protein
VPQANPGARAPHLWLEPGVALYDRLGPEFTLLRFSAQQDNFESAFRERGVPLAVLPLQNDDARALYGADLVLIRPDQHVAWRGNAAPQDAGRLVDRITGRGPA